jgi:hypothetical protein
VIVTYCTDNKEAAALVKKIRHSVAAWFFGYWQNVMGYRLTMVQKLMESFDVDAALCFSDFDPIYRNCEVLPLSLEDLSN